MTMWLLPILVERRCTFFLVHAFLFAAFQYHLATAASLASHLQPVVGVLTIPPDPTSDVTGNFSTIDASYVKWLESGGAIVVPILFNATADEVTRKFYTLSGIFLTGGPAKPTQFTRYYATEQLLLSLAQQHAMPLWGTCLGFQSISDILAGADILSDYNSENLSLGLELSEPAAEESRLFRDAPASIIYAVTYANYTTNWHQYGVSPDDFDKYLKPQGMRLLSTNRDRDGIVFVSTMEHQSLPIYATQWHPEANAFDRDHQVVDHSSGAVATMQYFANFFVNETRLKGVGPGDVGRVDDVGKYPVRDMGTGYSAGLASLKYFFS